MVPFTVFVHPRVRKGLHRLWKAGRSDIVKRFRSRLDELSRDPLTPRVGLDIRRLSGIRPETFRLRIGGYRAIYEVDEDARIIRVTHIFERGRDYPS